MAGKQQLQQWLREKILSDCIPGLQWFDKQSEIFQIPWKHKGGRHWTEQDGELFKEWAIFRGRYNPEVQRMDPKEKDKKYSDWKATFRTALNKSIYIEHITSNDLICKDNEVQLYRFLSPEEVAQRKTESAASKASDHGASCLLSPSSDAVSGASYVPSPVSDLVDRDCAINQSIPVPYPLNDLPLMSQPSDPLCGSTALYNNLNTAELPDSLDLPLENLPPTDDIAEELYSRQESMAVNSQEYDVSDNTELPDSLDHLPPEDLLPTEDIEDVLDRMQESMAANPQEYDFSDFLQGEDGSKVDMATLLSLPESLSSMSIDFTQKPREGIFIWLWFRKCRCRTYHSKNASGFRICSPWRIETSEHKFKVPGQFKQMRSCPFPVPNMTDHQLSQEHYTDAMDLLKFLEDGVHFYEDEDHNIFANKLSQSMRTWYKTPTASGLQRIPRNETIKIFDNKEFLTKLVKPEIPTSRKPDCRIRLCFGEKWSLEKPFNKCIVSAVIASAKTLSVIQALQQRGRKRKIEEALSSLSLE